MSDLLFGPPPWGGRGDDNGAQVLAIKITEALQGREGCDNGAQVLAIKITEAFTILANYL